MEVVELADVARPELITEDPVVVEPTERVLAADVGEYLVEVLFTREHGLTYFFGVRGRQHLLADLRQGPDELGGDVTVQQLPEHVDIRDAADEHVRAGRKP
jgi:hypothetical protein